MPHPAAVGTHPPSSPTSTSSASSTSSRSSRRANSGRQRHPGAHRDTNKSQPQIISTKNNIICGQQPQQQSSQAKAKTVTQNQRQQQQVKQTNTNISPPSTERTGPEGEADEEEPSEIDSFLLDDNEIESEEENLTRTSNSSPIPNIDQLSPDKEYLGEDNNEEDEEDSDDLDADLRAVNSIASSTSHRRFLLTENLLSSAERISPTEEFRVAGDGKEPETQSNQRATHFCSNNSSSSVGIDSATETSKISVSREKISKGVKTTLIGSVSSEITTRSKLGASSKVVGLNNSLASSSLPTDIHPVDPETQARLEALLEAAGIGKLTGETKQLTDPEVLKRLTSSVSCALDEAAAALTRMRTDPPGDGRSLVEACNEGDISKVRKLLDEGRVSVHDTTEEGESLLSLACSAGYFELAQVLLAMRANVEDRGMKGDCTPLMEAASAGHTEIVKLLLSHNAEVNAQSSSGNTPLMYACAGGHEDVVQMLLEAQANVEDHNENGHTPLMEAASAGHVGVAKILLKNGAGINTHSNEFKESALTLACYKGHLEMVRFLLDAGADQEHKTDEMHTALMEASMDGHVEVARLLLDSGAQVNMPADSFESPLTLAACGGHVELAMLLLERGANIEEVNDEGYTPLMEASREGHEEMVALLLSQGADINAQTEETQETALTLACCGGFLEVADFLIKAGANIELGASTPLMESAQEGHIELTKYLLQNGADVNAQSGTGDTALTYACENGHTDVSDLLLKYNAVLEHESEGGRTPLMKAARAGHLCTVQFLISKGADVNRTTTNNDHTPLSLACAGGHISIVELLLQHGADPYHKLKDNSTMLIEAAKGGHTNVVSILIDYPNSLVMTNEAAMAFNDPTANGGPPQASLGTIQQHPSVAHQQTTPHHAAAAAVHPGQVSIGQGGQMSQEQIALAMQHEQHNAQVVGGVQVATAHLQQTGKNINIVPTGQLTGSHPVVSGPAPPPPPPPPSNQQNKSVLRKSQRTSATVSGATNQSLNNQHSAGKDGNKDPSKKGNTSSLASSAARSILNSAGMTGMPPSPGQQNIGIEASGFDYIEGSGFVMEGLEDKGLDAKSYIQSVLRGRHEGGATREEQIIQKEQILAELQRVEKELKEKGPAAAASNVSAVGGPLGGGNNVGQQFSNTSGHKAGMGSGGNTSISLNIPAATEILQNMANLTLQDQHHRGADHHPCSSTVTSSTQTVQVTNQNCPPTSHPGISSSNVVGQDQPGLNISGSASLGTTSGNSGKRSSSNNNNANVANLLPNERPKVKASRKIPGKESLSPSSKDNNIMVTTSANTSPGGSASVTVGSTQPQQTGQTSMTNIVGTVTPIPDGSQQQAKKSDSQLQAARHQHSQQLAQLQQLQQLNQQLQEQVLYQRQQKQQNQATLAALQQNAIANQQQLAALQQNVAQLQQLEQHILQQQQQATSHADLSSVPSSSGGTQSSSSSGTNVSSSANSTQIASNISSVNTPSNNSSAANQQHQQLQGKIQQIVQQKQQLQAQIKQFQQQVEQQLAYTQNATPGTAMGQLAREGVPTIVPNETLSQNQGTTARPSNKRSKDNAASSSKDNTATQASKMDSSGRQTGGGKNNRNKNQAAVNNLQLSGESQPASSVANAAYELVQASQALQAVQALQQQHLDTSSASPSNQGSTSPGTGDVEPLTQDPALLTSLDPVHLAAAVQNCPLPLDANCQAILNGYKEGMQAGQALATTLQAAVNSGSMQIQYPIQVPAGTQGGSPDYNSGTGQPCQIGSQQITGGTSNQMTATSIGLDQLLLQGPQFPFGPASVDSNGQINFTSAADLPGSSYIHHQGAGGSGNNPDASALFLPAGAQLSVPPGEHGQLVLQSGGQMISQHGQLQPDLPGVVQCPGGTIECLDSNAIAAPNLPSTGTPGKKTKHGGAASGKNKKHQQVAHSQEIQDALDKQGGQAGDLFSAAAAAAAAAAATAGIPVPSNAIAGQGQPGVIPNNCSATATIEAQQYAQGYTTAPCGPDGVPLPGAPGGPGMDGLDANQMDQLAAVSVDLDSATESNHDTALTLACAGGHEDLVTLLLGRGSDIEHRDKKGFTPLILAATAGHEKVVEILLEHNADIEAQSERTKDTPLSLACSGGRYEVVEVLLKKHANKEHRNVSDYTPLSLAASGGYVNIIKLLLAHGAEINSRTGSKLGISPLMLAAMNGHTASVKLLLDMGSDINAQIETNRNTALTLACFQGRHEVVSLLLDRKANVEHRAKTGLTPLMEAASGGYGDVGRVLLDKNADVNAPPVPSSRDTALTIAADKGHYRFVQLLLERGAQVDVRNKKGNSSLWLAANGGHIDVVQLLYSAGADIDSQDNRKVSCLMAAFRKGHSKVVKWMVKHVAQYPSDQELTRYIATINDKDLLKKCNTCMDIIRVAKDRQAAEAAKNANSLLEELDREKNIEESKKAAAARKREKKKRKKMEKKGGKDDGGSCDAKGMGDDDDDCDLDGKDDNDVLTGTEDEKEKTPEILAEATMQLEQHSGKSSGKNMMSHNNNEGDSGIDANSQGSSASREDKMDQGQTLPNNKDMSNKDSKDQATKKGKNKNKKGKTIKESPSSSSRERERNEKNAASSVSTSEHEPTPPPLPNTSTAQQLKISSNTSSNIIGNNRNENTISNQSNTFGKQTSGSSGNITNQYGKGSTNDQDHNENKENKKQHDQLSYTNQIENNRNDTRVPQTPDQQVIINTFDPSCIQGGTGQAINKKPGRGRRNLSNASGSQIEPHEVGYPRSGGSTGNKHLLGAPNNMLNANSPRKNGSSRGGGNSGPNAGNRNNSGVVEDAGWKEVVRKSRKVVVSASAISRVIGRGGNNINAIRELSGAHIEVEKQGKGGAIGSDRTILIKGSADATRQASSWINSVIANPDKDLSEIIGKPYRQLQAQQQSGVGSFIAPMQQTMIVTNSGATGMSSSSGSVTNFTSNKSVVTAGQVPSSFGQAVFNNSSTAGGFTNLMAAKPNFSGGSTVNTKLTGSLSTASSLMTTSVASSVVGNKVSAKDGSNKDKEKKSTKTGAGIPAFTSGLASANKGGSTTSSDKGNKSAGSFAAVAGGIETTPSSSSSTATPSFGMISAGGPHPGSLSNQQQKPRVGGKSGAPPGISAMDSRGNKTNVSQFSGSTAVQPGQFGTSMSRTPGLNTNTSSSSSQFNAGLTSNNLDMMQTQSSDKEGFGQYGKGGNQKQQGPGSVQGGRQSNPSLDNKDYSPFKTLGVVSWGAPGLSAMEASKEDKLGTANWAPHLPNMGPSSRMGNAGQNNLQPPPSIPLPPSASGVGNSDSLSNVEMEMAKGSNQDLASKAPGYRANVNASPSWGALSNNSANGNKAGPTGGSTAADALIYQQQQERCNSAPGTPISPIGPSPIGPPTSTKSGASSTVSPGSETGEGGMHSFNNRGGIGPIGPNTGFGSVRSITPDDMDYRRRAGLPTLDGKESLLSSMNTGPPLTRQSNNSSTLSNKPTILDPTSDLSILNAAAQMAASGGTFNDFLAQQNQKGFGLSNQSFNDLMNNGSANSSSRIVGPSNPPPPLPQSITSGLYNDPAKLNPNAPDFLRLQAPPGTTNFVRAPGPSGNMNSGLGRNMTSMASSTMPNKYALGNNQYGGQASMASRMNFGQGNSNVAAGIGNGPNQLSSNAVSSNQLVSNLSSLSNFSNILNNQSINALLNQANLTDLSGIGNGGNSFDTMSANLVGGKSIREINEMLSGSTPGSDQSNQSFSGNGSSLFMNNPLLNSQHGGNASNLEEQPKSKAIGSERHRGVGPTPGLQPGMAPPQLPSNQGQMPPNMMNKGLALNRMQTGGLRTQAPSNPWDGPGYSDGNYDQSSGRQNQSGQPMQQFPFPSSLQGHTLESLLKSTANLPGVDNFGDQAGVATSGSFLAGLGNGGSSGAPPSPLSGLGSPANVTPNKNDFTGGFGGPGGDSGINFPGSQQAPIGSAGKNMSMGYSMESVGNRPNDSAVNSVRRNMNTMWGNTSAISTKKWGDDM